MEVGSVVYLKSGGPAMTVEKLTSDAEGEFVAKCVWCEGGVLKHRPFLEACLTEAVRSEHTFDGLPGRFGEVA